MQRSLLFACLVSLLLIPPVCGPPSSAVCWHKIKAVGKEGQGNIEAPKAWQELVKLGPGVLPDVLAALDDADPTSANWLRNAVEAIADRGTDGQAAPYPLTSSKRSSRTRNTPAHARRLAYEWLVRSTQGRSDRLIAAMLNDPGQELRRDAVAARHQGRPASRSRRATRKPRSPRSRRPSRSARDRDQVDQLAKQLVKVGETIDLPGPFRLRPRLAADRPASTTPAAMASRPSIRPKRASI